MLLMLFTLCLVHIAICHCALEARADCNAGYTKCSPNGAVATAEPPIGSALSTMYVDVVDSVQSKGQQTRDLENNRVEIQERATGGSLCCKWRRLEYLSRLL